MRDILTPIFGAVVIVLLVLAAQWLGTPSVPPATTKKCQNVMHLDWRPEQLERVAPIL